MEAPSISDSIYNPHNQPFLNFNTSDPSLAPDQHPHMASSHASTIDQDRQPFIKMEDLQLPVELTSINPAGLQAPSQAPSKPTKKRKSWGQVLPEPKTSLPPRKRAKTEDEKEQRRIERIKRNRAAAHTSRERKRLEAEGLAERNDELTKQLAYAIAQIEACKVQLGGSLPQVTQEMVNEQLNGEVFSERRASSTVDPRRSFASSTPEYIDNEDSSCKSETQPTTPLPSHPIEAMVYTSDETQHSAAMLWDLQCPTDVFHRLLMTRAGQASFQTVILCLISISLRACYQTLLMTIWSMFPSKMRLMMASSPTPRTSSTSTSSLTRTTCLTQPRPCKLTSAPIISAMGLASHGSSASALLRSNGRDVDGEKEMKLLLARSLHRFLAGRRPGKHVERWKRSEFDGKQDPGDG
ncbi:hypothetical protein BJ546DRAFT_972808 [Cryomyces antarcticus]